MTPEQFNKYLNLYKNGILGDDLKDIIQTDAIDIWLRAGGVGIIEAVTGFGKSHLCKSLFKRYRTRYNDNIEIVVPTDPLYDDFKRDTSHLENCKVSIINTYVKSNHECGLLVVDEVHKIANRSSKFFKSVIPNTQYKYCLGLTATLNDHQKDYLESIGVKVVFTVTRSEANQLGLLPEHDIFNYGVELTTKEQINYEKAHKMFNSSFEIFKVASEHNAFQVAMACCQKIDEQVKIGDKYRLVEDVINIVAKKNGYDFKDVRDTAFVWKASMQKLGNITDNAHNKLEAVYEILAKYQNDKALVFSQSIEHCETIATKVYNARAYHSKSKNKKKLLEAFILGAFTRLIVVEAIDMGFNDKNITLAINVKFDSEFGQMLQRIGRAIRLNTENPDKYVRFFNLYCKPFTAYTDDNEEYTINPNDYNKLRNLSYNEPYVWIDELNET